MEYTFVMVKPDGVRRGLVGEIIHRYEIRRFSIKAIKMLTFDAELTARHYAEHVDKSFYPELESYITSGPVVAMVLCGENIVALSRQMIGATDPANAYPGTIRADYATSVTCNIIHGSDSTESAQREISIFFPEFDPKAEI